MSRDRGAAAVWVLACAAVMVAVAAVVVVRTLAVLGRHRAEAAADLAALAAAARIGIGGDPCAAAGRIAHENAASVRRCTVRLDPGGRSGDVVVRVAARVDLPLVGAAAVTASARAARLPASARATPLPASAPAGRLPA